MYEVIAILANNDAKYSSYVVVDSKSPPRTIPSSAFIFYIRDSTNQPGFISYKQWSKFGAKQSGMCAEMMYLALVSDTASIGD